MEMLVTIAIVAVLVAIIALFLSRNLNRSRAAVNSTNLRATRSLLAMELLADPENAEDVLAQVMSTAPKAEGVDLPGLSVPDGMPMDAIITEDGVDTFYGDYNEENFNDVYQDGVFDGEANRAPERETQEATQVTFCAVLDCFSTDLVDGVYCSAHQIKICTKSILNGDVLVLKTHPRIRFRGAMDALEAEILLCRMNCPQWEKELGELLALSRNLIRWEVMGEPARQEKLCGLTAQELRSHSHRPQDYYGQTHFMPEVADGPVVLHLNRCRTVARAAELAAAAAFTDEAGNCTREDLLRMLNRMSSMIYILMIREKARQ